MKSAPWIGPVEHAFTKTLPMIGGRSTPFAIAGCVAAVNGFAGKIATEIADGPLVSAALNLWGVSAIVWFAIGTLFIISHEGAAHPHAEPYDKAAIGLTMLLSFAPLNFAGAIGLLLCGAYLAGTSAKWSVERRLAIVIIALTGPLIWGRFLLALFGPFMLKLDASLAAHLAGVQAEGNVVSMRDGSGSFYVALGCSSVHNMSLAILLFVTLVQFLALRCTPLLLLTAAGATLAMAAVNVMRLATLARFPQYFDLVHTGWAGAAFGALSFVAAGAIIAGGIHAELSR